MQRIASFRIPLPRILGVVLAVLSASSSPGLRGDEGAQSQVPFPAGYREWVHVKSGVIGPEFPAYATEGGIHHIYANPTALAAFKNGTFEDGSILVYDLLSLSEKGGVATQGARRRIDVMVKDSKRYSASGGWGFGRYMGEDHEHDVLTPDVRESCYKCHENRKAQGFVFSELRE
ncbi:MAG TPA: cytochrome P460 family protein [Terracidiphilus sp.]|jgi:hypothetical protein|nr:cytochrome P460 family protein [Terracidiphilus sp.]